MFEKNAYSAAVYLVTNNAEGSLQSNLLISKTKLAPIKTLSIPRLELLGALMLTRIIKHLISELDLNLNDIFYWTDSTVAWLNDHSFKWNTYVATKTGNILTTLPTAR